MAANCDVTDAEVDAFGYDDAEKWLNDHSISFEELESLEEMIALIKLRKQGCIGGQTSKHENRRSRREPEVNTQQIMKDIISRDQKMKKELSEVYEELVKFIAKEVGSEVQAVLTPLYGDYKATVAMYMSELVNDECPIVVAGETSAGKSSLLNLLLGTEVLPHSLLCATSTVCRLHNSDTKRFEIQDANGTMKPIKLDSVENWKEKLRECVSSRESRQDQKYKLVDIYWPIPMLQDRVTIVDTPGVGESEEMTERLIKYLPNAVAFIYVINSAIAGGIQEDKLLRIIETQLRWESEGKLSYFDSKNAIFVCNKWDRVEESKENEEEKVWEETMYKLKKVLPTLNENQVFRMSTSEASRYLMTGMGYTEKFQELLHGIERMVPASLKAKVTRHFKWLEGFLKKLQTIVASRIHNARLTEEEKRKLYDTVMSRLSNLRLGSDRVRNKLTEEAERSCKELARKLHRHLNTDEVREKLMNWTDDEAPNIDAGDFDVAKFNAERVIMIKIQTELRDWEENNSFVRDLAERLTKLFTRECKLLGEECTEVDLVIQGIDTDMQTVIGDSQPQKEVKESLFTGSEKVILAVAAPLWIPLVTAASVLFFPVGVGMFIREALRENKRRKDYMANKVKFMRDWTMEITDVYFTEDNLEKFIFATYLNRFKEKIKELCDNFIPNQIEADEKHINAIHNDMRSSQEILNQYNPIRKKLQTVMGKFYLYDLKYMFTNLIDITDLQRVREIGKGNFSDVFLVEWKSQHKQAALKILRRPLVGEQIYNQLSEVECLRVLRHKNIVEFHGPCYSATGGEDSDSSEDERGFTKSWKEQTGGTLMLLLECCDESLESRIFNDKKLQCRTYGTIEKRENAFSFYVVMAAGVCDGLSYIHKSGYLHRDLKLSNVLIKNGTAKICDLGFARHEIALTGTFVGTLTHMSPEMLNNKPYTNATDIFSLGILLWELWYGKQVYSETMYCNYTAPQLIDLVKNGTRPLFKEKYMLQDDLQQLVSECWDGDQHERPKAEEVGTTLRHLYTQNYNKCSDDIHFVYSDNITT